MIKDGLLDLNSDLTSTHLALAVDNLFTSRNRAVEETSTGWEGAHRYAISSILHGFAALESALNRIGHLMLFNSSSPKYIAPESRDVPLEMLARAWPRLLSAVEKLRFIMSQVGKPLDATLESQIRELANLRNWLSHGVVYQFTLLLEEAEEGTYTQVDREDKVNWEAKFPNTKFSPIDKLAYQDALLSTEIILKTLKVLARSTGEIFFSQGDHSSWSGIYLEEGDGDIEGLLRGPSNSNRGDT